MFDKIRFTHCGVRAAATHCLVRAAHAGDFTPMEASRV